MTESAYLIAAARALRPLLPDLIGDQANTVGPQLDSLLAQANQGQPIANQIRSLIRPYPDVHAWVVQYLQDHTPLEETRSGSKGISFNALAGNVQDIPPGRYVCPQCADGNPYSLRFEGGDVPDCDIHHIPRVPASDA